MAELELIGAPQSNFVRTVRLTCAEKSVPYRLNPAFPHTPDVDAIHPFGKIPVMRHGSVSLSETKAICTYIDLVFDGPKVIPRDPVGAAKTEQWVSLINTEFDPIFARQYLHAYFFSGLPDGATDHAKIAAVLPKMRDLFVILDRELTARPYLAGDAFTLADMFLLPLMYYLQPLPESGALLQAAPGLLGWFERVSARPCAVATVPPPMPKRG
jgi:glutathione S-transferase